LSIASPERASSNLPEARPIFLGDTSEVLAEVEAFICAEEQPAEVDRPLATVLFTDIVASTEQLAARGDAAWRRVLDDHDQAVDRIVTEHRGAFQPPSTRTSSLAASANSAMRKTVA
jgi:class 3 adenylate cyclase